jgi:carbon monoxide dehydrogenase subunit G
MEHEAFVPFPVGVVRRALAEPDRVARCVSAVQRDTASPAGTLAGRLRLRIGGSSITYRGSLRIAECDGGFEIEGEGTESRGSGVVKLALVIGLDPEDGGTRLGFSGAVQADGRLTEYDEATVETAGRRLLERFVTDLTTDLDAEPLPPGAPRSPRSGTVTGDAAAGDAAGDTSGAVPGQAADGVDGVDGVDGADAVDQDDALEVEVPETVAGLEAEDDLKDPPAEAAHARRTMIGRSAEEVDHAPPRGRYAPVAAPSGGSAGDTLRWAAPAAAALLASAVVVGRALRKRR